MPAKSPTNPGIADVAAASDVSIATVSRVLTGKANVAEEVRLRVLDTVRRMNYRPLRRPKKSASASHANEGPKPPVAYLCDSLGRGSVVKWAPAFASASRRLQESGSNLIMHFVSNAPNGGAVSVPPNAFPGQFGAVLAVDRGDEAWSRALSMCGLPAVRIGYFPMPVNMPQIIGDSFGGVLRAMEHILSRGHKRIAIWRATTGNDPRDLNEREKYAAYRFALDEAGIEFKQDWEISMPYHWQQVVPNAKKLLAVNPAPTAILIDNDWMTSMILRYPGGEMPLPSGWHRQFELVHFIDSGRHAIEFGPACVSLAMDRMGELAANLLLEQLRGQRFGTDHIIKVMPYFYSADQVADLQRKSP